MKFWLSFVDTDNHKFLGVTIIEAADGVRAVNRAHFLGINPGGEAVIYFLPPDFKVPAGWEERLIGKEELAAAGYVSLREHDERKSKKSKHSRKRHPATG